MTNCIKAHNSYDIVNSLVDYFSLQLSSALMKEIKLDNKMKFKWESIRMVYLFKKRYHYKCLISLYIKIFHIQDAVVSLVGNPNLFTYFKDL